MLDMTTIPFILSLCTEIGSERQLKCRSDYDLQQNLYSPRKMQNEILFCQKETATLELSHEPIGLHNEQYLELWCCCFSR